jgi:hypothetical protein
MEIPWVCRNCGGENWIDLLDLFEWPMDKLTTAMGFICTDCGMREAISFSTPSLRDAERRLTSYEPTHRKFPWLFGRLVRKQSGVNERGEAYGESKHPNMAVP